MPCRDDLNVGPQHDVIADRYGSDADDDAPAVRVKVVADLNMFSVIAPERGFDIDGFTVFYAEDLKQHIFLRRVERQRTVKRSKQQLRFKLLR